MCGIFYNDIQCILKKYYAHAVPCEQALSFTLDPSLFFKMPPGIIRQLSCPL